MITKVVVEGHGQYYVDSERVNELLRWLSQNQATYTVVSDWPKTEGVNNDGKVLINEG